MTEAEAARRLEEGRPNELSGPAGRGTPEILKAQLFQTLVALLLRAAGVSAALGNLGDAVATLAIVVLHVLLGFRQEHRAEKALVALTKLAAPEAGVRRDGCVRDIPARLLVRGDIVLLEAGNLVPADVRILLSVNLRIQEASLTGESAPVDKGSAAPARRATETYSQQYGARSATKLERGARPRKGRQPRRSGCAVRPRRTTEHGEGVLPVRRAGRRESDKGLAVQTEPQAPVAQGAAFSAATGDPRRILISYLLPYLVGRETPLPDTLE